MANVVPEHSKSAVSRASKLAGLGIAPAEEIEAARAIVANYRSAHAFPLNAVTVTVRQKALEVNAHAVVAQRLKRLPTILDKLRRIPTMSVTTMHDLGGCRVILGDVGEIDTLVQNLLNAPKSRNRVTRVYDYLRTNIHESKSGPKPSGYRGMHLVYEYHASKKEYDGLRIELQVRTQLQHAWATAVETMDLFSRSELKYSAGDPDVIRFFALVSSLMAAEEGVSPVPGAMDEPDVLVAEMRTLETRLGIVSRLQGYAALVSNHATSDRRNALTLELHRQAKELTVTVHEKMSDAEDRLAQLEALDDDDLDVVLVNIARIGQLQAAYPNYYADTSMFTDFVNRQLATAQDVP